MAGPSADRITEWEGGSLGELVAVLQSAALPVRIEVIAKGATSSAAGEVHLLAGGLADAFAGSLRRDDAMAALQRLEGARFLVECRLPDPQSGSLSEAGPSSGSLKDRSLAALMRYCEEYVLTCRLEVARGDERAVIGYRRGEIISTTVGDAEGSDQLPEVMAWTEGSYEIVLPEPVLPSVPGRTRESSLGRLSERKRHGTLPMGPGGEAKADGAAKQETKTDAKGAAAPTAVSPAGRPAPAPSAPPAGGSAPATTAPVPTAPLPAEMTRRGTPPVPAVPVHPAPARPGAQAGSAAAQPSKPAPGARSGGAPVSAPMGVPRPAPVAPATKKPSTPPAPATAATAKTVPPATAAAPAKPTPPATTPAKPAQAAAPSPAQPAKTAAPSTTQPAKAAPPTRPAAPATQTAAPAAGAPSQAPAHAAAPAPASTAAPAAPQAAHAKSTSPASSNDLLPASGTIEAKPKHAANLPPSTAPVEIAEQPGQTIVTTPAQPPAPLPAGNRPSEPRRKRMASRPRVGQHTVRAYVFVGLAIGIGIVLAYWAYWYLPFGHH